MGLPITGAKDLNNPKAEYRFLVLNCAEAITKGNVVRWTQGDTSDTSGDYAMASFSESLAGAQVSQSDANLGACGIAMETGAAGAWIKVQTKGLGQQAIVTGGAADVSTMLYAGAAGATAETALDGTIDGGPVVGLVGIALKADTSTALAAGEYIVTAMFGW